MRCVQCNSCLRSETNVSAGVTPCAWVAQELYALEDIVADYAELKASVTEVITEQMLYSSLSPSLGAASKLHNLCSVSGAMAGDAAFARQVKRRHLAG